MSERGVLLAKLLNGVHHPGLDEWQGKMTYIGGDVVEGSIAVSRAVERAIQKLGGESWMFSSLLLLESIDESRLENGWYESERVMIERLVVEGVVLMYDYRLVPRVFRGIERRSARKYWEFAEYSFRTHLLDAERVQADSMISDVIRIANGLVEGVRGYVYICLSNGVVLYPHVDIGLSVLDGSVSGNTEFVENLFDEFDRSIFEYMTPF